MRDVLHGDPWDHEEDYSEDDDDQYWQEETKDAVPYQMCMVSMETLITRGTSVTVTSVEDVKRYSPEESPSSNTKDRVFHMDETESAAYFAQLEEVDRFFDSEEVDTPKKRRWKARCLRRGIRQKKVDASTAEENAIKPQKRPREIEIPSPRLVKKPSIISIDSSDIAEHVLKGRFGDAFIEGQSMPRRFAINITESIVDQLKSSKEKQELAATMHSSGHHIFTVFDCMLDPRLSMRNGTTLVEDVTVKISGVSEDHLMDVLTPPDATNITAMVSAISQSVAALPSDR